MKRLLLTLFLILAFAVPVFGAGDTFVVTTDNIIYDSNGPKMRVLTCTFLANSADGTIADLTIYGAEANSATYPRGYWSDGTSTTALRAPLTGWFLYQVEIDANHAGTEPTENSELYILKNGYDILAGNGVDQVDNSAERMVFASDGATSIKAPITDTIVVRVTQQAGVTNSATGTVKLILVP